VGNCATVRYTNVEVSGEKGVQVCFQRSERFFYQAL